MPESRYSRKVYYLKESKDGNTKQFKWMEHSILNGIRGYHAILPIVSLIDLFSKYKECKEPPYIVFGGYYASKDYQSHTQTNTCEIYNPIIKQWTFFENMPQNSLVTDAIEYPSFVCIFFLFLCFLFLFFYL